MTLVIGLYLMNSCQKKGMFHWEEEIMLEAILCKKYPLKPSAKMWETVQKIGK